MNGLKELWAHQGIRIAYQNRQPPFPEPNTLQEYVKENAVRMLFSLSEGFRLRILIHGKWREHSLFPGYCGLYYHPDAYYEFELPAKKATQILYISFPCGTLTGLMEDGRVYHEIKNAVKDRQPITRIMTITPLMSFVINQILAPSVNDDFMNLFFLAKVLDLLCSFFNNDGNAYPCPVKDMMVVQKARSILENSLGDAPSVKELAMQVGVSSSKLKQVFPKACGMPPYAYLRKIRMEKALCLINEGKLNITEIAYDVGYNSLSHFARTFAKHFGIKPSQVRRRF